MTNNDDNLDEFDPVDDLQEGDFLAGDDFADDEWDSYDESGADQAPAPAKKKSSLGTLLIIGGGVVAAGAVALFMMGGGAPSPTATPDMTQQVAAAPESVPPAAAPTPVQQPVGIPSVPSYGAPPVTDEAAPAVPAQPGMLTDPDALQAVQNEADETYQNTEFEPVPLEGGAGPVTRDPAPVEVSAAPAMPPSMPVPDPALAEPDDVVTMPTADSMMKPAPVPEPVADSPAPVMAAPAMPATSPPPADDALAAPAAATTADSAVMDKLDQIVTRLDRLEADMDVVRKESAAAVDDELDGLRKSIASLEKKMGQRSVSASSDESGDAPQTQTLNATPPAKKSAPAVRWVLKGAQPGRAMVSRAGESEMKTVEVGDTLPGIGRVTAIGYEGGRWVVTGTQGRITQ